MTTIPLEACIRSNVAVRTSQNSRHLRRHFSFLSPVFNNRLETMVSRHNDILKKIEDSPEDGYLHGKELASLSHAMTLHENKLELEAEEASIHDLLEELGSDGGDDDEMRKECMEELEQIKSSQEKVKNKIMIAILPKDENDYQSDAIVEIRAGTGGDEATLFASELQKAYEKTAKGMNWEYDIMSESKTDLGGIKEAVLSISGRASMGGSIHFGMDDDEDKSILDSVGPYGLFKYESGVHRVQRVPVNDTRIHTSACSVAVLPLKQDDGKSGELLPMSELKIDVMRSSGAGGQHVNTTNSAVRITHIATGITASIQDERSQHKNKAKAMKLISARVRDKEREEERQKQGEARNSLLGGGDRSERIRTYNYPQDRVSDHRSKHTTHGISKMLDGGSQDGLVATFYPSLQNMVYDEQIAALQEEE